MHSFGITNGSNEEQPSSSPENGVFSNGDVQNNGSTSNGNASGNISNGTEANGNYTNGNNNEDDGDLDDIDGPYMNGNSHKPPKKDKTFVARSSSERDIIRLIGQQLCIMGLDGTVAQLIQESGCRLDHPTASKFRSYVMDGEWEKADTTLKELQSYLVNPKYLVRMKFLLLEQKFLECIEDGREIDALKCLQNEITQLKYNIDKLPTICSYLFTNSIEELKRVANWEGKGLVSRAKLMEKLQNFLPATIMLPPRRLQCLLNQAIEYQKERCPYHNMKAEEGLFDMSLLTDHLCSKDDLPSETLQTLTEHKDEVWFCRFSNDGTRLATGSKDGNITIWDINPENFHLTLKHTLSGHTFGVAYFAWSPDDRYILALGPEESPEFWLWDTQSGTLKIKNCHSNDDSLVACAWHKDGKKFVAGGTRGQFYQMDLNGSVIDTWEGVRVQCLAYKNDGKTILAADSHHRIRGYNFEELTDFHVLKEDHSIMSFVLDKTGRLALINIENQGVHLWDLEDRILIRKFQGITQGLFTIHSCFGGVDQLFVASGSEDNKVYIWHLKREHPISVLKGHSRTVNCVHWNPRYPWLLASASDDTTVRIWCAKHYHSSTTKKNDPTKIDLAANKTIATNTTNCNNNSTSTNSNTSQMPVISEILSILPSPPTLSLSSIRHASSTSTQPAGATGNYSGSCLARSQLSTISLIHSTTQNSRTHSFTSDDHPSSSNNSSSNQDQSCNTNTNTNSSNNTSSSSSSTTQRRNTFAFFVSPDIMPQQTHSSSLDVPSVSGSQSQQPQQQQQQGSSSTISDESSSSSTTSPSSSGSSNMGKM